MTGVFKPTGTTTAIIEAVRPHIKGGKLLDLACGCGIIGKSFLDVADVYASDISGEAIFSIGSDKVFARQGNLFEPWKNMKFDYIIDDVSGIAEDIAKVSPWFNGIPCDSGKDGADLICKVLEQAHKYLNPNGKLFFPIVSLSNVDRILDTANRLYHIECLSHTEFPLSKSIYEHIDLLRELKKEGIQFQEKYGLVLFSTDVYMAQCK